MELEHEDENPVEPPLERIIPPPCPSPGPAEKRADHAALNVAPHRTGLAWDRVAVQRIRVDKPRGVAALYRPRRPAEHCPDGCTDIVDVMFRRLCLCPGKGKASQRVEKTVHRIGRDGAGLDVSQP